MSNRANHRPTVSVCLPIYNGKRYLAAAIQSILSQSFDEFELIAIDDRSEDDSFEIMESFAATDSRVKLHINESRLGPLANFNQCFKLAKGHYIKPFSQDDLLHTEMLRQCVQVMERESDVALVSVNRTLIDSNGESIRSEDLPVASQVVASQRVINGKEIFGSCVNPLVNHLGESSTVMFKSSSAGGGYDPKFSQLADLELWLRILMNGDYYFIPDTLCHVRCHPNSVAAKDIRALRLLPDFVRFRKKYESDIQQFSDTFIESNVTWLSRYYQALIDQKILPPTGIGTQTEESDEYLELALHALTKIARDSGFAVATSSLSGRSHNERLIEALEREVQVLLSSRSWRITKLLRDFGGGPPKAATIGQRDSDAETPSTEPIVDAITKSAQINSITTYENSEAHQTGADEQQAYIAYLREQIIQIKLSRSWSITRPLRILESALKTQ